MKAITIFLSLWVVTLLNAQTTNPTALVPPVGSNMPPRARDLTASPPKLSTNFAVPIAATNAPAVATGGATNAVQPPPFVPILPAPLVASSPVPTNPPIETAPAGSLAAQITNTAPPAAIGNLPDISRGAAGLRLGTLAGLSNFLNNPNRNVPSAPGAARTPAAPGGARIPSGTIVSPNSSGGTSNTFAKPADEEIIGAGKIRLQDADISQVLSLYSLYTGRTILRPATLPAAKITLENATPLTVTEASRAIEAVLALNQISVVNVEDKFVKVVPEAQANRAAGEPVDKDKIARFGPLTTHIMQLKHTDPKELMAAISPFSSMPSSIVAVPSSQTLILRDYAENIRRMMEIIEKVDVIIPPNIEPLVIPIKYALAADIQQVLSGLSAGGSSMSIGGGGGGGRSGRLSGGGASMGSGGSGFGSGGVGGMGGMGGMGGVPGQPGYGTGMGGAASGATGAAGARNAFAQRLGGIIKATSQGQGGQITLLGAANIIADERANSLLVFAEKEDITIITNIIAKLDVVLAQVLIETLIYEVSLNDSLEYGVYAQQVSASKIGSIATGIGALNPSKMVPFSAFSSVGTNATSQLSDGLTYVARFGQDLDVTAKALATDNRNTLISRPRILTSHAKEASIFVGSTVPYITSYSPYGGGGYGGYGGYGGGYGGGYSQYQQMQIGIQLSILPFINSEGLVVMDIKQRIQNVTGKVTINGNDVPITSDKEATAYIAVRDRDTVILGGYINSDIKKNHSGVPILKDIPILGHLFKTSSSSGTPKRSEMIVLVRPTVLNTPESVAIVSATERDQLPSIRAAEREYEEGTRAEKERLDKVEKKKRKAREQSDGAK